MATAAGWAAIPINLSFKDALAGLTAELNGPVAKAAKAAGDSLEAGIGQGAEAAAQRVEKAQYRVKRSTQELTDAESKYRQEKLKQEAADKALEAAAERVAAARVEGGDKAAKAEEQYLKAQARSEAAANATRKASEKLKDAQEESARAAKRLADAEEEAASGTDNLASKSKSASGEVSDLGSNLESAGGKLKDFAGLAAGFAGIASLGEFVSNGLEFSNSLTDIQNQLGLSSEAAQTFGDDIKTVMGSGVASSMDEASSAISDLNSQFDYLGSEGEQTAADLSDNFIGFSKTFGVEMSEATQTAGQLVTNGLAGDVEQAADLMTAAMQRVPAQMRGELPEIINEYGTNFRALGFDGEEAFSMLVNAADKGKWALDKTGDALKEFTIRGSDMSSTSVAAYESIGLNAEEMSRKVAAGGDEARGALEETAQKLLGIEDPAERANTAIALFGTPLEDLSVDQIPQFLDSLTGAEDSMQGFEGSSQAVADNIANSLQGRLDSLKGTVSGLAGEGFMKLWDWAVKIKDWASSNSEWLVPLVTALGTFAGIVGTLATGFMLYAKAQAIATGAAALFNGTLLANPITLVVAAVAALVAGLVVFFTKTETGRKAWESFTQGLADGWNWLTSTISAGWEWLKTTFFDAWNATVDGVKNAWTGFTTGINDAWSWVTGALAAAWDWVRTTVFDAWSWYVDTLRNSWSIFTTAINDAWNWLTGALSAAWEWVKAAVFLAWQTEVQGLQNLWGIVTGAVNDSWNWLTGMLASGWDWVKTRVFDAFGNTLDWLKNAFQTAVDGIAKIWDGIKAVAARPVKFVVDTVYNSGIRKAWNLVARHTDLEELQEMDLGDLGAYASGGVLPGYTPGRDVYQFIDPKSGLRVDLGGGEGIARPEVVRAMGAGSFNALNAAARTGGVDAVRKILGQGAKFASGGIIDDRIKRTLEALRPEHDKPYQYAGVGNPSWDCSGLWSGTVQELNAPGTLRNGRIFNTESTFENFGFAPGLSGRVTIGVLSGAGGGENGHMAGTIDGMNIESSGSHGVQIGGAARGSDHSMFNHTYTLVDFPGEFVSGGNGGGGGFSLGAALKRLWDGAISAIPSFNGIGQWAQVPGSFLKKTAESAWNFLRSKIPAGSSEGAYHGDVGAGVEQWRGLVEKILTEKGFSTDLTDTVLRRMNQESSGNPAAINGWDSNAAAGTPSKGLMQVIDPTFQSYKDPGYDDIWDPESNIRASMNYAVAAYGSLPAAYNKAGGYALGGILPKLFDQGGYLEDGQLAVNQSGEPEPVFTAGQWRVLSDGFKQIGDLVPALRMQAESISVMVEEIGQAYDGGDWGYGELARVLGNEQVAQAIVNGAAALGEFNRTMAPVVADSAKEYATSEAKSALSYVGLDPLVDLGVGLADKAWAAYQENPVSLGVTGDGVFAQSSAGRIDASIGAGGVKVVIEAESDEDLVRVAQVKELASRIQGLEVELRAPQRPVAAATTRGGVI